MDTLRAPVSDRINYLLRHEYIPEIHLLLDFAAPLDALRLQRALNLLVEAEPVFECRFVPRPLRPHWKRLESPVVPLTCVPDDESCLQRFLVTPLDPLTGPQVSALLLGSTRLALKVNHMAADARKTGSESNFDYIPYIFDWTRRGTPLTY